MANRLLCTRRMKRLLLCGVLIVLAATPVSAQETDVPAGTAIASAQVSGLDLKRLSPGLQEEIGKLAGTGLDRERLRVIAARIEAEHPRYVAAVRATQDPAGDLRVVFVVARIRDEGDREVNINERYIVEHVEVRGIDDRDLSEELRAEIQTLVGLRLDSDVAERVETHLREALPDHEVRRAITRGTQQGQIRVAFIVDKGEPLRWLHFERTNPEFVYHSDQGWGGYFELAMSSSNFRLSPIIAIDQGDDLVEEYSGFGVRFETRKLGTERLGASIEWSTFDQTWRDATLSAISLTRDIPPLYETRSTVTPRVRFAVTRALHVGAGVSITELETLNGAGASQMANAALFSIEFGRRWPQAVNDRRTVMADLTVRAGTETLESDLVYTSIVGRGEFRQRWGRHRVLASAMLGSVSGTPPMFERFVLGDSETLRGWDKYDIAPLGTNRMVHATGEYHYRSLFLFLDAGSLWNDGADAQARFSAGGGQMFGPVFWTVGFPLNTDEVRAVFTMGIRFSHIGVQRF